MSLAVPDRRRVPRRGRRSCRDSPRGRRGTATSAVDRRRPPRARSPARPGRRSCAARPRAGGASPGRRGARRRSRSARSACPAPRSTPGTSACAVPATGLPSAAATALSTVAVTCASAELGLRVVRNRDRHRNGRRHVRIELDLVVAEREPRRGRGTEVAGRVGRGELDREPQVRGVVRDDEVVLLRRAGVERHRESRSRDLRERRGRPRRPEPTSVGRRSRVAVAGAPGAAATGRATTTNTAATPTRSAIDSPHVRCPGRRRSERRPPRSHRSNSPIVDGRPGAGCAAA